MVGAFFFLAAFSGMTEQSRTPKMENEQTTSHGHGLPRKIDPRTARGTEERGKEERGAPGVACGWVSSATNPPPWRNGSGGVGGAVGGERSG